MLNDASFAMVVLWFAGALAAGAVLVARAAYFADERTTPRSDMTVERDKHIARLEARAALDEQVARSTLDPEIRAYSEAQTSHRRRLARWLRRRSDDALVRRSPPDPFSSSPLWRSELGYQFPERLCMALVAIGAVISAIVLLIYRA